MKQEAPIERSEALRHAPVFESSPFGGNSSQGGAPDKHEKTGTSVTPKLHEGDLDREINRGLEVLAVRWKVALASISGLLKNSSLLGFACSLQDATSRSVGPPPLSLIG
jgi:hypothetical protein